MRWSCFASIIVETSIGEVLRRQRAFGRVACRFSQCRQAFRADPAIFFWARALDARRREGLPWRRYAPALTGRRRTTSSYLCTTCGRLRKEGRR